MSQSTSHQRPCPIMLLSKNLSNSIILPIATTVISLSLAIYITHRLFEPTEESKEPEDESNVPPDSTLTHYSSLIGNTPLLHLPKLSSLLKASIYLKLESHNPGGTGKDRVALAMLDDAEARGLLPCPRSNESETGSSVRVHDAPTNEVDTSHLEFDGMIRKAIANSGSGGIVVEGTSGSTGISLATLCAQRQHSLILVMPDDQAPDKHQIVSHLGAFVHIVPNVAISHPRHYVQLAQHITNSINQHYTHCNVRATFLHQFDNVQNHDIHYSTTGPELWKQMNGNIDAFVMSCGTGGTIAGVGNYLKHVSDETCKIVLVDPTGSAIYNRIKYHVCYANQQSEQSQQRHRYDSIAEGIGLDRITANLSMALDNHVIDDAIHVLDQEAIDMAHWLVREEGVFVGCSSAMNVIGAMKVVLELGEGCTVVTVMCDGGQRHLRRFWCEEFIKEKGLCWPRDNEKQWNERLMECLRVG